jgi:hypothetical protein
MSKNRSTPFTMRRPKHSGCASQGEGSDSNFVAPSTALAQKVFNCVVDENALLAAGRKSVRDGIRKWVATGAIRLFVPLHTLERLHGLRKANKTLFTDAQDVIEWLDNETSKPNSRVTIQGVEEAYNSWSEVEKFLLPETLLSAETSLYDVDNQAEDSETLIGDQKRSDKGSAASHGSNPDLYAKTPSSPRSVYSATSPGILNSSPIKTSSPEQTRSANTSPSHSRNSSQFSAVRSDGFNVPHSLRPLFSHILWLINQYQGPTSEVDSLVLLSNDHMKRSIAQRFGIRVKSSDQLRGAIKREVMDYKNRTALVQKQNGLPTTTDLDSQQGGSSGDEDEVVFKGISRMTINDSTPSKVWDPNSFGRGRGSGVNRGPRGGRSRGNGAGRGLQGSRNHAHSKKFENGPIDPDSYMRPPPASRNIRGGRRRLWEPT